MMKTKSVCLTNSQNPRFAQKVKSLGHFFVRTEAKDIIQWVTLAMELEDEGKVAQPFDNNYV